MSKILVTGGAGFIGSHLVDALVKSKHKVFVIDHFRSRKKKFLNSRAKYFKKQVQNKLINSLFKKYKFDVVFHLAAQKDLQFSKKYPTADADTNIIGSLRVIEAAKKYKVKKLVFYSTAAVYDINDIPPNREINVPSPATPYGIAKFTIEQYLAVCSVPYTVLRISNVYGPRQDALGEGGVVAIFCSNAAAGKSSVVVNTGRQTRDLIFIQDVVRASIKAVSHASNRIVNISTNNEVKINDLYKIIYTTAGRDCKPQRGKIIEEQYRSALSNKLAKKILKWQPETSLNNGINLTLNWFMEQYEKEKK